MRVREFRSAGGAGPDIEIYRNRDHAGWFAARDTAPAPAAFQGSGTGGENYFFLNLGTNYESAGFLDPAIACYRTGLRFAPAAGQLQVHRNVATRLGFCLLATRPRDRALAYLDAAQDSAAAAHETAALRWIRRRVAEDPAAFSRDALPRLLR